MTNVTSETIAAGLRELGVAPGNRLLVHSSLSSFGHVVGGADAVIDALLDAVGPEGTVMVPTLTATAAHSPDNPPEFDPEKTPCWTGTIPETFRQREAAVRSLHPTHSVAAIGADAEELTVRHHLSLTPCDEESPYGMLASDENGFILLLGVKHQSNTTFHHVEEIAGVDYHMQHGLTAAKITTQGETMTLHYLLHQWGTPRRFDVMAPIFAERGIQRTAQIGESTVHLVNARQMVETTLRCLRANSRLLCK